MQYIYSTKNLQRLSHVLTLCWPAHLLSCTSSLPFLLVRDWETKDRVGTIFRGEAECPEPNGFWNPYASEIEAFLISRAGRQWMMVCDEQFPPSQKSYGITCDKLSGGTNTCCRFMQSAVLSKHKLHYVYSAIRISEDKNKHSFIAGCYKLNVKWVFTAAHETFYAGQRMDFKWTTEQVVLRGMCHLS